MDERQVVGRHLDRHAGTGQRPPQRGDAGAAGADQHRHPVPLDAVLEVRPAQQVGQPLCLGPLGVVGDDLDPAVALRPRHGLGRQERLARLRGDAAGEGQPAGDAAGAEQDARPEPAGAPEHDDRGGRAARGREAAREVEDAAHVGAAEAVDRLVRIAHHGEVATVTGDGAQQRDLARVGVLVLVHEDVRVARPQLVAVRLCLDDRAPDQVGVVGGAEVVEHRQVLLEEQPGRDQLGQVVLDAERAQAGGVEPLLARPGEHRLHLAHEAAGAGRPAQLLGPHHRLGVVAEQLAQHHVGLRRREQPDGSLVELGRGVLADQCVGEGVERRARGGRRRARHASGDPVTQLLGGLAGEGEGEDGVGRGAPVLDPVDDRLDEGRGLAGAGTGEDEERATLVVDHALLVLVELGHHDLAVGPDEPVAGGRVAHEDTPSRGTDSVLPAPRRVWTKPQPRSTIAATGPPPSGPW